MNSMQMQQVLYYVWAAIGAFCYRIFARRVMGKWWHIVLVLGLCSGAQGQTISNNPGMAFLQFSNPSAIAQQRGYTADSGTTGTPKWTVGDGNFGNGAYAELVNFGTYYLATFVCRSYSFDHTLGQNVYSSTITMNVTLVFTLTSSSGFQCQVIADGNSLGVLYDRAGPSGTSGYFSYNQDKTFSQIINPGDGSNPGLGQSWIGMGIMANGAFKPSGSPGADPTPPATQPSGNSGGIDAMMRSIQSTFGDTNGRGSIGPDWAGTTQGNTFFTTNIIPTYTTWSQAVLGCEDVIGAVNPSIQFTNAANVDPGGYGALCEGYTELLSSMFQGYSDNVGILSPITPWVSLVTTTWAIWKVANYMMVRMASAFGMSDPGAAENPGMSLGGALD